MRFSRWAVLFGLLGCDPSGSSSDDACALAEDNQVCDECFTGNTTCTFGAVSVTEASCDECQARSALYAELCDAGETATEEEILEGVDCMTVAQVTAE